jgi:hypothetical protein
MKRVMIILVAAAFLWIPEYLWAMDAVSHTAHISSPHYESVTMNIDSIKAFNS